MQWFRKHQRSLVRAAHLLIGAMLGVLVYAPEGVALSLRTVIQIGVFPLLLATGMWLWYGTRAIKWIRGRLGATPAKLPHAAGGPVR